MTGREWGDLPGEVRDELRTECGSIQRATSLPAGLTGGLAARLDTPRGPVFVKALPADSPPAPLYQRERHVGAVLPESVPAPRMLWSGHTSGWIALLFEHVAVQREVDLGPASSDLGDVMDIVRVLGEALTPNPGARCPRSPTTSSS
ncbi:hypothetical protein ABZV14_08065 [Streptosporangium canum]|uniref:hypothetical protein n=1 Tax=Streptosporangium canum TaxID=324952 RepID=UPI0033BC2CD3